LLSFISFLTSLRGVLGKHALLENARKSTHFWRMPATSTSGRHWQRGNGEEECKIAVDRRAAKLPVFLSPTPPPLCLSLKSNLPFPPAAAVLGGCLIFGIYDEQFCLFLTLCSCCQSKNRCVLEAKGEGKCDEAHSTPQDPRDITKLRQEAGEELLRALNRKSPPP